MRDNVGRGRAIFMDRDGTVSEEVGYMYHAGLFRLYPWTGEAIQKINESGTKSVLITNQSGVERGYFKESTVHEVHQVLQQETEAMGSAHGRDLLLSPRPGDTLRLPQTETRNDSASRT